MALHFDRSEYASASRAFRRPCRPKSWMPCCCLPRRACNWLTGYDTFGYCIFQCLVVKADGTMALLTRSRPIFGRLATPLLLRTSISGSTGPMRIRRWTQAIAERDGPAGLQAGVEYDTHGMTGRVARLLDNQLATFGELSDASYLVGRLRLIKSASEFAHVERAAALADDALKQHCPDQGRWQRRPTFWPPCKVPSFAGGGDYPANEFIIGSGGRCPALPLHRLDGASSTRRIS